MIKRPFLPFQPSTFVLLFRTENIVPTIIPKTGSSKGWGTLKERKIVMPYLRFNGFTKEDLFPLIPRITQDFARTAEVDEDKVKVELHPTERLTKSPCSLEILMFQRSQDKHDRIAAVLHEILESGGFEDTHIFYIILSPQLYYKNGKPLSGYVIR